MNSLRTSRVVVIDDEPEEALPVIGALSKLGIGCVYLRGDKVEDLPEKPLTGIRVVVLDMRLGVTGTAHQVATTTATVFRRVVSPDQGPLIVLLWTKHAEDFGAFRDALFAAEPKFKPVLLLGNLEKPAEIAPETTVAILEKVTQLASEWSPINFLWNWEQLAHDAATGTTAMLARHVSESAGFADGDDDATRRGKWLTRLREIMRALAIAAGGKNARPETAGEDLLETVVAIHLDHVEQGAAQLDQDGKLAEIYDGDARSLTTEQAISLNSMLLLSEPGDLTGEFRPGDIFVQEPAPAPNLVFERTKLDVGRLKKEVLKSFCADKTYSDLSQKAQTKKGVAPTPEQQDAAAKRDQRASEIAASAIPMLIELTPSCDFAQRKRCMTRLLGGLLVPSQFRAIIDGKNESLRALETVAIPGLAGNWIPVFSSRMFFSIPESDDLAAVKPVVRLRGPILNDLRHWWASQSARIGYLKFDTK